jgi:transcriptional regulator with XRE-family HTH domain
MMGNGQPAGAGGFATALRLHRKSLAMSQEDLSDATRGRVAVRTISDLERGVARQPRSQTLRLLAEALRLSGAELAAFTAAARPARLAEAAAAAAELRARAAAGSSASGRAGGPGAAGWRLPTALMTSPPLIIMVPVIPASQARRPRSRRQP